MCVPLLAPIGIALGASAASAAAIGTAATATVAAGAFSAYGQYQSGIAQSKYYNYAANQKQQEAAYDLKMGAKQGELIQNQAEIEGKQISTNQAEFNATQRATEAAKGIYGGGTAEDITKSTLTKEQLDQSMIRYNADIKSWSTMEQAKGAAWTATNEATMDRFAGKNAKRAGAIGAAGTLLGTAASVATLGMMAGMGGGGWSFAKGASSSNVAPFAGLGG